jgi:flagellum-specific ATP synthase
MSSLFDQATNLLNTFSPITKIGKVKSVKGLVVEADGPNLSTSSTVSIVTQYGKQLFEVVGFEKDSVFLMPLKEIRGVFPGAIVQAESQQDSAFIGKHLLGRVVDFFGEPLDGKGPIVGETTWPLHAEPPQALKRRRISDIFDVGVRSINTMLSVGVGQRIGIMAGSGVGKSTLLGMMARYASSDINVIALIGERGREVREFIERDLGEEGLRKSVVIVATGDTSPLARIRAAHYATACAEYFRSVGKQVVFMLDSVTRLAMAQREIGLSIGEPPSTRGYTPSVFSMLPKILERVGLDAGSGSITSFYTVLVEGDDMNEPIADAVRGILDGHIVLSRLLASAGHYPAIDILQSVSRVMTDICSNQHLEVCRATREILAQYKDVEDLLSVGAYQAGQNPKIDRAIAKIDEINTFLKQQPNEHVSQPVSLGILTKIIES